MFKRLLLLLVVAITVAAAPRQTPAQATFARGPLAIVTADGRELAFEVEVADTDQQRMVGLMYRRSLAAGAGMLFDFKRDVPVSMWMKNTLIPLDMLFVTADGRIAGIAPRTVPQSLETIASPGPVRAVLELNGGVTEKLGISVGDRLRHPMFER